LPAINIRTARKLTPFKPDLEAWRDMKPGDIVTGMCCISCSVDVSELVKGVVIGEPTTDREGLDHNGFPDKYTVYVRCLECGPSLEPEYYYSWGGPNDEGWWLSFHEGATYNVHCSCLIKIGHVDNWANL
jgi:hypothetical protein